MTDKIIKESKPGRNARGEFIKGNTYSQDTSKRSPRSNSRARVQALCEENAEMVMNKIIEMADKGNEFALKLMVERIFPAPKPLNYVEKSYIRDVHTQSDANDTLTHILNDVAVSGLAMEEADQLMSLVQKKVEATQLCMQEELNNIQETMDNLIAGKIPD